MIYQSYDQRLYDTDVALGLRAQRRVATANRQPTNTMLDLRETKQDI